MAVSSLAEVACSGSQYHPGQPASGSHREGEDLLRSRMDLQTTYGTLSRRVTGNLENWRDELSLEGDNCCLPRRRGHRRGGRPCLRPRWGLADSAKNSAP